MEADTPFDAHTSPVSHGGAARHQYIWPREPVPEERHDFEEDVDQEWTTKNVKESWRRSVLKAHQGITHSTLSAILGRLSKRVAGSRVLGGMSKPRTAESNEEDETDHFEQDGVR